MEGYECVDLYGWLVISARSDQWIDIETYKLCDWLT